MKILDTVNSGPVLYKDSFPPCLRFLTFKMGIIELRDVKQITYESAYKST